MNTALTHQHKGSPFSAGPRLSPERAPFEFYPTPPEATRALLAAESFKGPIWEPACGDGAIARELRAAGYDVVATDLVDYGYGEGGRDFLAEPRPLAPDDHHQPALWARPGRSLCAQISGLHRRDRRQRCDAAQHCVALPSEPPSQLHAASASRSLHARRLRLLARGRSAQINAAHARSSLLLDDLGRGALRLL